MTEYIELPEIFPLNDITVKDEEHLFEVFQGDTEPLPKTEYTLDKAPIDEIKSVTGTVNGVAGYEFEKGVDYELSASSEKILWLNGDRPDAGTRFAVTYRTESIIGRYVGSGDEELEDVEEKIIDATQGKFVREAEGEELDEIGKLFGDTIGKRRGRSDAQYSTYLQSVVQSFVSRGTKSGIRAAVAAALGVIDEERAQKIDIIEDFDQTAYEVQVPTTIDHSISTVRRVAEVADPSGVNFIGTRYEVPPDQMLIGDDAAITVIISSDDAATVADVVESSILVQTSDTATIADATQSSITATSSDTATIADDELIQIAFGVGDTATIADETTESISTTSTSLDTWDTMTYDSGEWDGKDTIERTGITDTVTTTIS